MDRKAWLLLAPVALIAVGAYVWATDDAPARSASPQLGAEPRGFADPEVLDGPEARAQVPPVLGAPLDAGPPRAARVSTREEGPRGDPLAPPDEPRGDAVPNEGTHGYQLGVARRRAEVLDDRVSRLRERVARLEAEDPALAARQRAVLERIEGRLEEVREEQTRLDQAARADGTLGDAERGYQEDGREREGRDREGTTEARLPTPTP